MSTLRGAILGEAKWAAAVTAAIHYQESRPMPLAAFKAHSLPITTDCSGFVTCCYYAAGAPDPNGLGYTGQGYTGTLLDHLAIVPLGNAAAGDLVVFGPRPGLHVVLLMEAGTANGGDPQVCSHGSEAGPRMLALSDERAGFPGEPVTVLRGVDLTPAPPVPTWDVHDGHGDLLGTTHHPARWAMIHPRRFRLHGVVTFRRRGGT